MRNLTPEHLKCFAGSCPSVWEMDDGRLQITGALSSNPAWEETIIIDRALLANIDPFPSNPEAPANEPVSILQGRP